MFHQGNLHQIVASDGGKIIGKVGPIVIVNYKALDRFLIRLNEGELQIIDVTSLGPGIGEDVPRYNHKTSRHTSCRHRHSASQRSAHVDVCGWRIDSNTRSLAASLDWQFIDCNNGLISSSDGWYIPHAVCTIVVIIYASAETELRIRNRRCKSMSVQIAIEG